MEHFHTHSPGTSHPDCEPVMTTQGLRYINSQILDIKFQRLFPSEDLPHAPHSFACGHSVNGMCQSEECRSISQLREIAKT